MLFFFTFLPLVNASTIFTDDFNSYDNGDLIGQGGWSNYSGYSQTVHYEVQSSVFYEGSKAIALTGNSMNGSLIYKLGNPTHDGSMTFYFRASHTNNARGFIGLGYNGGKGTFLVNINQTAPGKVFIYDGFGFRELGSISDNVWHFLQIQWRSSDHTARYRLNGGEFTDYLPGLGGWRDGGLDGVILGGNSFPGSTLYFDTFQENSDIKNPVLIIPGILGSAQKNGEWIIDPILHTYDNLIDTLKVNGYIENETLFKFPYDWHQSNVETAIQLKDKIQRIKEICSCSKVNIIGHSMGGLVARQYIGSNNYKNDIDKLIFLGTPHLGAPKDYLVWEGAFIGSEFSDKALERILTNEGKKVGYADLFDYVRNKPILSVKELLPIYDYLVDLTLPSIRHYPNNYPTNTFLENLNDNLSVLNDSNINIYNIIGKLPIDSTINFIGVVSSNKLPLWEHGYPDGFDDSSGSRGLSLGEGDGTVPPQSSGIFPSTISINSNHANLPTKAESQILNSLLGSGQYTLVDNFHFPNLKLLIIKLFSPVDMQVVAPDGKKLGKDFLTNQEVNEIPYAFYSGYQSDDEYITIINPEDGQYKVILQGTDSGGEYTISSAFISDNQELDQDFQGHIIRGKVENINIDLSSEANTINVAPDDSVPPEITISSPNDKDYLRSDSFNISYSATDSGSGLFSISAKLDTINVYNGETVDLFYQSLGDHNLTVEAQDNVNNKTNLLRKFRIVATVGSTIYDINRAYTLGWISKKSIRDGLVNQINRAARLISVIDDVEEKVADNSKALQRIENIKKKLNVTLAKQVTFELTKLKISNDINQEAYNVIFEDINWLINDYIIE